MEKTNLSNFNFPPPPSRFITVSNEVSQNVNQNYQQPTTNNNFQNVNVSDPNLSEASNSFVVQHSTCPPQNSQYLQANHQKNNTASTNVQSFVPQHFSNNNVAPPSPLRMPFPPYWFSGMPMNIEQCQTPASPINAAQNSFQLGQMYPQQMWQPSNPSVPTIPYQNPPVFPNIPPLSFSQNPPMVRPSYPNPIFSTGSYFPTQFQFTSETVDVQEEKNETENTINEFLQKLNLENNCQSKNKEKSMTVSEFRELLKKSFLLLRELSGKLKLLHDLGNCDENMWNHQIHKIKHLKAIFTKTFQKVSDPKEVEKTLLNLKRIERKRLQKKRLKERLQQEKLEDKEQNLKLHNDIGKWLDVLREKDEQKKRNTEMQKEADCILSEVRKKIYEAKRTKDKIKIFEKLRLARKENAVKKGLTILPKYDEVFEAKMSELKELMSKQLSDYEAEEIALKVMLETEQEDQHEKESQWHYKKLKNFQNKKHATYLSALFGKSKETLLPNDPLYYYSQYYDRSNHNIDCLMEIRCTWDMYLVPPDNTEGSSVPQQWIVPELPSSDTWAEALSEN